MSKKSQKKRASQRKANSPIAAEVSLARREREGFLLAELWRSKAPFFLYGMKFVGLLGLFYMLLMIPALGDLLHHLAVFSAFLVSSFLNLFGKQCHASEGTIYSPHYAITVAPICTGVELVCMFAAAVLVFPVPWSRKLIGLVAGMIVISAINLLRIVSLYVTGRHFPSFFEALHEQIWGFLITPIILVVFLAWMHWALQPLSEKESVP